jgi:hypothetical protein
MCPQVAWNKRDLLTYAAGVGAKNDEFHFVYGAFKAFDFTLISLLMLAGITELGEYAWCALSEVH